MSLLGFYYNNFFGSAKLEMPLLQVPKSKKTKLRSPKASTGEPTAVPAGPAAVQAGPAQLENVVEVVAKAPTQSLAPKSLEADMSASPNRLWKLKHSTTAEFQEALLPKGQEFCFAFRDDYRQEGDMSSDDDEESLQVNKIECERVHEMQKDWGQQMHTKEPDGEDAPFFSNQICFLERQTR